jgi:arabinose-5-phosphate isomerase
VIIEKPMRVTRYSKADCLTSARSALECDAKSIARAAGALNGSLLRAVGLILAGPGKVVVTGMGKSGLVGQKVSATLCSTGTTSVFLHPSEAVHGDLGIYSPGDVTILISKSGATAELLRLVPVLRTFHSGLIGILGNLQSPLAKSVDVVLDGTVAREADPCNIAPTCSAIVAMALGDALASALMTARDFTLEDYARLHPGGQLGRNLCLRVQDVMRQGDDIAWVRHDQTLKEVVIEMTRHPNGAACVVEEGQVLRGLITDGDVRRALQTHDDIRSVQATHIMNRKPTTVHPEATLREALRLMEDRPSQISVLPVLDQTRCLGLIRIHDIYAPSNPH